MEEIKEEIKKEDEMIETREFTSILRTDLTAKERLDLGAQMANVIRNVKSAKDEFDSMKSRYGAKIKGFEAELTGIAEKLNTGWEERSVSCSELRDFRTGTVTIVRKDTWQTVEQRAMSGEERQMGLFTQTKEETPTNGEPSQASEPEALPDPGSPTDSPPDLPEDNNPFYNKTKEPGSLKMPE